MQPFSSFLDRWQPAPARVLEIGAGSGALAVLLREHGHQVVAIDPQAPPGAPVQPVAIEDLREHGGFEVVVAQRSLHHVQDLDRAFEVIAHALVDDGLLLLHEFCWDRLDERTGRWLHHHLQRVGHHDDEDATSFLGRWRKEHRELATYRQLRGRLDRWFRQLEITWVPYLAEEYLHGDPVARREEATRLRAGTIQPVAFHYAGRRLPG
jgi:SAM-dependent methyltransferase